ncbi:Division abnormally delayed protein [Nesidiocoris tenuis]|uniref:Syndecan n=1 Tax=Nesidiocoris tenuis TaxID=355587 RepID=A0ABN7APE6_9HEMI|nr:Division abnormally delayed protein [Nesidiocoris tenuis]
MYLRLYILISGALFSVGIRESYAEVSPTSTTKANWSLGNEIYIDEEALEGSGNTEVKYDLESSGSGFGPDDEDGDGGVDFSNNKKEPTSKAPPKQDENTRILVPDTGKEHISEIDTNRVDEPSQPEHTSEDHHGNGVVVMNTKHEERTASFFAQPGILAAVIGGAVVGLLCAILVVMFIVYRMRKKDEGSYALDEPKRSPTSNSYSKNSNREFYA